MTRKLTRKTPSFRGIASLIAVLTVLIMIALAALAQTKGANPAFGKSHVAPVQGSVVRSNVGPLDSGTPSAPFFLPPVIYDPKGWGAILVSVAIADVNGDGKPDLLVANLYSCASCNGSVAVLLGNGDGTFQPAVTYDSGWTRTQTLVVADVNGDGKPDLVVGNDCGCGASLGVLLGNGDGTFQPAMTYDTGLWGPNWIATADVNGDGKVDVVASGSFLTGGAVSVLRGNGDGTFGPGYPFDHSGGGAGAIAVADLNGDGKPDIAVANGAVGVLLGTGDNLNPFQPVVDYSGNHTIDVAIADVNGDGKPDIVEMDYGSGVGVLLGNGDGTFQPRVGYGTGGYTSGSIVVSDVNHDGKLDIVVGNDASGTVAVLLGNGDGTFQPAVTQAESDPRSMAVADLNGNGRLDLVVGSSDGNITPLVGVMLHVGAVSAKTKVVASLNPSLFAQPVKFTATVSSGSGTPPGTVIFFDGSTSLGSATLVNGHGSISTSVLQAGSNSITAVYQGSLKFNSNVSAPLQQVVNPASTTTSLASSQNPAVIYEVVRYTATVASQYGGVATGTMVFQDGGTTIGTGTLAGNQAAYSTKYSTTGTHSITATYSGDANNTGSVSSAFVEQINQGFASKTVLTTSGSPSFIGQAVTFTATVTSGHGAIPDGELVTFYNGTTAIGTGTTASGVATFTTSSLTAKTHYIKATYGGDAIFRPSTGFVTQVVDKYPTTTTLTSSLNPSQFGQAVTFTAQVTSTGPAPTGRVQFLDGTTSIGYATLSGGVAKLTKSNLAVGTHPITAHYNGDANSTTSTSTVVSQVVQ